MRTVLNYHSKNREKIRTKNYFHLFFLHQLLQLGLKLGGIYFDGFQINVIELEVHLHTTLNIYSSFKFKVNAA